MLPKRATTEAGFWESLEAYSLNDDPGIGQGLAGTTGAPSTRNGSARPRSANSKSRALQLLDREFANSSLFVLPRIRESAAWRRSGSR